MNENTQPIELSDSNLTKPENEPTKKDTIDFLKKMIAVREAIEKSNPNYYKKTEFIITDLITIISVLEAMDDSEFEDYKKFNTHTKKEHEEFMKFIKKIEKQKNNILPILQSKLPEWHTMPIQKLASELQHDLINTGAVDLIVAGKGKKNEITSYVMATYEQPDAITMTGKPYTEFDRQVQDAVSSLWEYGHKSHIITPDMVARAMNHKTQTEKISPQFKGAVTKSLEKMRRIHITLDASEEIRKRKITLDGERVDSFKVDDYLLALKGIEIGAGGKTVKGYLIQSEPLLLTYAKRTKQLATVDSRLLDIKEVDKKGNATTVSIKSNEARVAVKGYLLRRIAVMKNDRTNKKPKQSNIILFNSLFDETGIPQDSNARRIKDYAFQVLDYFKAMNYIKGYTARKNRKSFDAVIIDL
uniref:Uncharacterized protein n=1 Tax=uncultured prokaryote TaxID=198431 RepID=A0A0H5PXP1_9ZZZZ|nr:hypothetical protein [uncultured prokaryote]